MPSRAVQGGISRFEFLVVVALIGVLASVLFDRLLTVQLEAERLEVSLTIRNMRTGVQLAIGERLMGGREDTLGELLAANPVGFLARRPAGYVGETSVAGEAGSWRFDPVARVLEYRPRRQEAFAGQAVLRWRLVSRGGDGGRVRGLRLEEAAAG